MNEMPPPVFSAHHFADENSLIAFCKVFFEHALDNVVLHNRDGKPIYCNPTILKSLNADAYADQLTHLHMMKEINPEYWLRVEQALRTKQVDKMLYEATLPAFNRLIYDEIHFSPVFDQHQEVLGVLAIGRDLGYIKQKNIAINLKQTEYLRTLIDSLPFPVWMKNQEGKFLTINEKAKVDFGMQHVENLEDTTDFDYFDKAQAQAFVNDDNEVMQTRLSKTIIENIPSTSGTSYLGYTQKTPVILDDKVVGTVGFSRNIDDELKLQQVVAELENEYFSILHNIPMIIIVYDLECRRIFANQYYLQTMGLSEQALIGKKPTEAWNNRFSVSALEFEISLHQVIANKTEMPLSCTLSGDSLRHFEKKLIPRFNTQQEICGVICIAQDVTKFYQTQQALEYQALYDELTGLANRTLFSTYLNNAKLTSKQNNTPFAIMLLDLDGFKAVNDSMGHALGDLLLKEVAGRISLAHDDYYVCCRLGGDEFAILYSEYSSAQDPENLASSILNTVANVYHIEGSEYFISASLGIAIYPDDTDANENLLKCADIAMYAAKDSGRNTYRRFSNEHNKKTEYDFHLAHALRRSLDHQELYLEYQPLVDIKTHQIVGAEALCRWQNKKHGLVPPSQFISIAERTGLIVAISKFVLRDAFKSARVLNQQSQQQVIPISVNISARLFKEADFINNVIALLQETECRPVWIKFEITETLLLDNNNEVMDALNTFNQIGIMIALDDFGTGQSSLAYLHKFPIHQLKIDRSFVNEIGTNKNHAKLVNAIISLAQSLDKEIVAEGIETLEQAQLLQSFGCKIGQGYLYAKPLTLDLLIQKIHRSAV